MTWLKKSDEFSDECRNLSDAAYRTHDEGLLWVMRRENGGRFPKRELHRFAETLDPDKAAAELVAAGFWRDHGREFEIVHHMHHQVEIAVLIKRRENTAERTRRWRRREAGFAPEDDGT
jgi:hypothetical protein